MELGVLDHVAVFAVTLALTMVFTPLALRVAVRRRILDHPSDIKAQESPVPYLGGVAILVAFTVVVVAAALLRPPESGLDQLVIIMGLALLLAAVGLVDDLRGLSPVLRIAVELGCGVAVWATPAGADLFANDAVNLVITVLWVVGIVNAFNFLDNMDGLSAGVAAIAAAFLCIVAIDNEQFLVATLAAGLAGCAAGFLRSNLPPARIYMGDAGAYFIGFLVAVLGLKLDLTALPREVAFSVPLLICGVPLFDTALVVVNRLLHGRKPYLGGRDHSSHRLVFVGIPVPAAVALIYLGAVSLGCLAIVQSRAERVEGLVLFGWVVGIALCLGVLLSRVPVYETSKRRHLMLQEVVRHEPEPVAAVDEVENEAEAS